VTEYDPVQFRRQVIHGWESRELHPDVVQAVKRYLYTGNPAELGATTYDRVRKDLLRTQKYTS
jgi:hypothetical protein